MSLFLFVLILFEKVFDPSPRSHVAAAELKAMIGFDLNLSHAGNEKVNNHTDSLTEV